MKLRIKGSLFHCGRCGKRYSSPLGHVCVVKTDFRARRKAAGKAGKPARPQHRYEACRDEDCQRIPCTAHRAGYDAGFADGFAAGQAAES